MDFHLSTTHVPFPIGLEKETAELAQKVREEYKDFFAWVQGGEIPLTDLSAEDQDRIRVQHEEYAEGWNSEQEQVERTASQASQQTWYLERHDIEYFYGLARPAEIGCACPFGWVEKVNRITDQQHAIFGVDRFPALEEKAAHMAWLLLKNQVFPDYNRGIGALAIIVMLGRNGIEIHPNTQDLVYFFSVIHYLFERVKTQGNDEDRAIRILGDTIRSWEA